MNSTLEPNRPIRLNNKRNIRYLKRAALLTGVSAVVALFFCTFVFCNDILGEFMPFWLVFLFALLYLILSYLPVTKKRPKVRIAILGICTLAVIIILKIFF